MRRSIRKPSQKSPRAPRRRCEANRPDSSSSSSGASKATLVPEADSTLLSPSPSKPRRSASHSPRKASTSKRLSPRPRSPLLKPAPRPISPQQTSSPRPRSPLPRSPTELTSPTKRTRSRTRSPIASPGSSRSSSRTRSPRKKTATSKSPAEKKSPVKATETVKSPTKRKSSKSPKRADSLSLLTVSETAPKPSSSRISKSTDLGRALGSLDDRASTSQASEGKSFVFVPTSRGLDHESLGRLMSQLYGYIKTVKAEAPADSRPEPSAPPYESDEDNERNLSLVIMDFLPPLKKEDPVVSEQLITGVINLGYVSSPSPKSAAEKSSSSSSTSTSTLVPKGKLPYLGELTSRRHSVDATVGMSCSAPERRKAKSRPPLVRQRQVNFDSSLSIEMHELQDEPEPTKTSSPTPSKRRLSKDKSRDPEKEAASSSKPIRKISFDDTAAAVDAKDMPPPPKPARVTSGLQQPSTTAYRDVRQSIESEGDATDLLAVDYTSAGTSSPRHSRNDFRDWCSESYTASWEGGQKWTPPPTPVPREQTECFWQACYRAFIGMFQGQSVTVQQFFQNLSQTFIARIRRPGQSAPRRYVLIAGYQIWMLIREASNDFWFLCGRSGSKSSNEIWGPSMSLQAIDELEPAQQQEVPELTKQAKRAAAKAARKARKKTKRVEESKGTVRELIELIHCFTPVAPLEPRRDFVPNDCPFITLSFEDNTPEEAATEEASAESTSENKPTKVDLTIPEHDETEAMPPRRRASRSKKD